MVRLSIERMRALGLALALAGVSLPASWAGAIACGDNVVADTVLVANLNCATDPALTVTAAKLDLNGFKVTSSAGGGIVLAGAGAQLLNGVVTSAGIGVALEGAGKHLVRNVVALGNAGSGFAAGGSKNTLDRTVAVDNVDSGYFLSGTGHRLKRSVASGNTTQGIVAGFEQAMNVSGNIVAGNDTEGIVMIGDGNKLKGNIITNNGNATGAPESGVALFGDKNSIQSDIALANGLNGFDLQGDFGSIRKVLVFDSAAGISTDGTDNKVVTSIAAANTYGVRAAGTRAEVTGCIALVNSDGIRLEDGSLHSVSENQSIANSQGIAVAANDSSITENVAILNTSFDLDDLNPACGDNVWSDNFNLTANPACAD